jgi:FkbM family methyltransferase
MDHNLVDRLADWAQSERSYFDQAAGDARGRIVIYGFGDLGKRTLRGLRKLGIEAVGVIDSKLAAGTQMVENVPCASLEDGAERWGDSAVFVVTVFNQSGARAFAAIREQLRTAGARRVVYFLPLFWKFPEVFLPHYSIDLPSKALAQKERIKEAHDLLEDERSREDYTFFIESVTAPEPTRTLAAARADQTYFPPDVIKLGENEVFVDCGAYDGDTLARFHRLVGGRFKGYVGVEPDLGNFKKLQERIEGLRTSTQGEMRAEAFAVGSTEQKLSFNSAGTISSAITGSGGESVSVTTLDRIVGSSVPTYVKMDIEGFELEALRGAEALLRRTTPRLAACIYHVQDHPWSLPIYIRSLSASYRIYIRRHHEYLDDVVVYAVTR